MEKNLSIIETMYWKIDLNQEDQTYLGRCYITLKRPCENLAHITKEEVFDFYELVKELEGRTKKAFGAIMHNWSCLMNDAYQVDPPRPQVHWHFCPRYKNSISFAGETFIDPNFGHHYQREIRRPVNDEIAKKIIEAIQKASK